MRHPVNKLCKMSKRTTKKNVPGSPVRDLLDLGVSELKRVVEPCARVRGQRDRVERGVTSNASDKQNHGQGKKKSRGWKHSSHAGHAANKRHKLPTSIAHAYTSNFWRKKGRQKGTHATTGKGETFVYTAK